MKILRKLGNSLLYSFMLLSALMVADIKAPEYVCKVDPTCRKMTGSEKAIAKKVFGEKLDTSSIMFFERPILLHFIMRLPLLLTGRVLGATAIGDKAIFFTAPNFLNEKILEEVRKKNPEEFEGYEGIPTRRLMVHELAHLAQTQLEIPFNKNAKGYEYQREPGKKFEEYGEEQQAEILADYFEISAEFESAIKDKSSRGAILANCKALRKEAQFFEPYFRPELPAACQPKKANGPKVR